MLSTALALVRKGLRIFPCRPRSKEPATPHGWKDATTDPAVAERWWRTDPDYNIALATGAFGGLFVVDVDDEDAEAALHKLELQHGPLPLTVEALTARGRHIYFKSPAADVRSSVGKIADGIDVRAAGGYVLAPPSIHPSGRRYCWSHDSANTFAEVPAWLVALATANFHNGNGAPTDWPAAFAADIAEGKRDETLTKFAGHLLRRYVDPHVVLELLYAWNATHCAPPLPAEDVERIVRSITAKEDTRRGGGPKWPTTTTT